MTVAETLVLSAGESGALSPMRERHLVSAWPALAISRRPQARGESHDEFGQSRTMVTTGSIEFMAPLHKRMPVILELEAWNAWLHRDAGRGDFQSLIQPAADGVLSS